MHKIFDYPLIIRERHLDTFGHVNNAVYLEIYEEARWDLVTKNGYGLRKIQETGQGPVILEIHLKFLKELKLGTCVHIKTELLSYEKKISKLRQWIENENGEVLAEAEFTIALFDLHRRKLIEPTPEWRHAIGLNNLHER